MWRTESVHKRGETEYLDEAITRIERDGRLYDRAEAVLSGLKQQEPLIADALKTPQSPNHHAEGPTLRHHLRLILMVLLAFDEEKLHAIDIEEFRRMKAYWGEVDEMEEIIKENLALCEVFAVCHDAAKWTTVFFNAPESTRGHELGFRTDPSHHWDEIQAARRPVFREKYRELYAAFDESHPNESDRDVQAEFFLEYRINVHYPGHDKAVHSPVYRKLLERVGRAHALEDREIKMLEAIIAHHLDPLRDFDERNPAAITKYIKLAEENGFDADDFIDIFQACAFLDLVCGSKKRGPHGFWHDPMPILNFFRSEHDYAPWRRTQKEQEREKRRERMRNKLLKEVGLDGYGVMDLLGMEPGPKFGKALERIQEIAQQPDATWPDRLPESITQELEKRRDAFQESWNALKN